MTTTLPYRFVIGGSVTTPQGFSAAAVACGIKQSGKPDLVLVASDRDCTAAGIFTRSRVAAAPVLVDRQTLAANPTAQRAVLINAGNANAATGAQGLAAAHAMQSIAADALGCRPDQVLVMSTGVIGVQLPVERVRAGVAAAAPALSPANGRAAAEGIMTTDTRPKHLAVEIDLPGGRVVLGGMAKGAGMIHPDMATMLSLVTTDAAVGPDALDALLREAAGSSFNAITIDGDTSTNDTLLVLANGASGVRVETPEDVVTFGRVLAALCRELALMIVRDGEGATKFVEIRVTGAADRADARRVASTIATSPLVKTAFAGGDPNWGRLFMAAGRSGAAFDQNRLSLSIGVEDPAELPIVRDGTPTGYDEAAAAAIFARPEFKIHLDLGAGTDEATMWTCDLSHDYVTINADYRT
jgi:glutamate N-acetyltransferase/amino-acid N-acetyltransferase